jgi:Amt family ammonium transporter
MKKSKPSFLGKKYLYTLILLFVITITLIPSHSFAQDPTGAKTGTLADIDTSAVKSLDTISKAKDSSTAKLAEHISQLASTVHSTGDADGHNKIAINIIWTLSAGFLVMFMQAGFAMV